MTYPLPTASPRLADQLERAFRGGAWHGPALMELLAGVDLALATWRPHPRAHSLAEVVAHLTFWNREAARKLMGGTPPPDVEDDWPAPALDTDSDWQALCGRLEDAHARLHAAVLALDEAQLDAVSEGSDTTLRGLLLGTLQHNAYHAGQVALLRKLAEGAP